MGLERGKVVAAALRLLDEVGLDGLTTRRLAQDLGVQGPALYWHFENKQALIDAMVQAILDDAHDGGAPKDSWDDRLACTAGRLRKAFLAHRDGARLWAGYRPTEPLGRLINGPHDDKSPARVHLAQLLRMLVDAGFSELEALEAFVTVGLYTIGWIMDEQSVGERDSLSEIDPNQGFEFGLSTIIMGLKARLGAKAKVRTPEAVA